VNEAAPTSRYCTGQSTDFRLSAAVYSPADAARLDHEPSSIQRSNRGSRLRASRWPVCHSDVLIRSCAALSPRPGWCVAALSERRNRMTGPRSATAATETGGAGGRRPPLQKCMEFKHAASNTDKDDALERRRRSLCPEAKKPMLTGNVGFDEFRQQNERFLPAEIAHFRGCNCECRRPNFECTRIPSRFKIRSVGPSYE
jgi:hypothetical protein